MERAKQAPRLTDERIDSPSDKLKMQVSLMLIYNILCTLPRKGIFREMAIKHLGLDLSMTFDGIIPLKFISKDSLLNLKDVCDTTEIEVFLHCLFVESEAVDVLGRGKVNFKMFICKMSPEEYGHYIQTEGKLAEKREDQEQKMLSLFVEELDPNKLFEDLRNRDLVEENDKQQVMDCIPRKQRMEFLIGRLNRLKRNEMLNILLAHCVKHDYCYPWKKIIDIYCGNTGNSHFTRRRGEDKSFPGEKVFTADFTLSIEESTGALKVGIQNRKWHLDTVENVEKEIIIMILIPESIEGNTTITGELHLNILNQCLPELVRDLDVKTVCMYILQRGVLDDVTVRDILDQKTTSDKTKELIKQIQQRDQLTYEKFKECLVQAKQEFLKVMLEEEEAKFAKEIEGKRPLKRKRSMHDDDTASSAPS